MSEDIAIKILTQTSENIQKLFELSTRIDERVKSISAKQEQLESRINDLTESHNSVLQNIAVLESREGDEFLQHKCPFKSNIDVIQRDQAILDKRLTAVEMATLGEQNRWKKITDFVIQLVWIVLAAWVLYKLNLQAPAVP